MAFLRDSWYAAAFDDELGAEPMRVLLLDREIAIYRTESGEVVALGNRCPHRFIEMHTGKVVGEALQCPYHGLQFGPSGNCVHNPHDAGVKPSAAQVPSYPLEVRYGVIWLWMGDPGRADADLIPDLSMYEERPGIAVVRGRSFIQADYRLVIDNLLDVSHVEFLHPHFRGEGMAGRVEHKVTHDSKNVHSIYASHDVPHGLFAAFWLAHGGAADDTVVLTRDIGWQAPSNLSLDIWAALPRQTRDEGVIASSAHLLAPSGRDGTQYLWFNIRNAKVDVSGA